MSREWIIAIVFMLSTGLGRATEPLGIDFAPRSLPPQGGSWTILVVAPDSLQPAAIGVRIEDETVWDHASWRTAADGSLWDFDLPFLRMGSGPHAVVARIGGDIEELGAVQVQMPPSLPDSLIWLDCVEVFLQPDVLLYEPGRRRRAIVEVPVLSGSFNLLLSRLDVVMMEKVAWRAAEPESVQYIGSGDATVWLSPRARRSYRLLFGSPGHAPEAMTRILAGVAEVVDAKPIRSNPRTVRP